MKLYRIIQVEIKNLFFREWNCSFKFQVENFYFVTYHFHKENAHGVAGEKRMLVLY